VLVLFDEIVFVEFIHCACVDTCCTVDSSARSVREFSRRKLVKFRVTVLVQQVVCLAQIYWNLEGCEEKYLPEDTNHRLPG
jgi:hypothetical protein